MAHVISYSHLTMATIPAKAWDETWLMLSTWKGMLQSYPGHHETRVAARALDNGDVRLHTTTSWEYPEQLEAWRESPWSAEKMLRDVDPAPYDVVEETLEDFS